jgi:predicted membrane channel-forming protein YqfA (hemolysin III family)
MHEELFTITFLNLWWIALWGITLIAVEYFSAKSKMTELFIYIVMMLTVLSILKSKPHLAAHII